ncbi:hypothetical protein TNCV_4703411 [Trichonephila clavipes]|nr:hypothetical protein TNCV_4703411 [Trichonephila clavipes]
MRQLLSAYSCLVFIILRRKRYSTLLTIRRLTMVGGRKSVVNDERKRSHVAGCNGMMDCIRPLEKVPSRAMHFTFEALR